jgi:polysaccharide biosynthesis protein PslH
MRVLQICGKMPFPPKDGGSIAMNMVTEGLLKCGCEVKVMAMNTPKHFIKEETIDRDYRRKTKFVSVFVNTNVSAVGAFINLFSNQSYNIKRFYTKEFECELIKILKVETFDVVQLEGIWLAPYLNAIRKYSKAKVVLRSHNVEYLIWEQLAEVSVNPLKKRYLKLLAKKLKIYELEMLNRYDGIATITDADGSVFFFEGCRVPMITTPFGVDVGKYKVDKSGMEFPSVFHIGAMDWMPNVDGIKWFLDNVWAQVVAKHPNVNLYLAGRGMPDWLKQLKMKNVVVVGEVEDSHQFINSKGVMIVPLLSGGGMRVKIIEGMALGKTIVSTLVGGAGIECEFGKDMLFADTAEEFVSTLDKCLGDKLFSESVGNNARMVVEEKYDNLIICKKLTEFYNKLIIHNS